MYYVLSDRLVVVVVVVVADVVVVVLTITRIIKSMPLWSFGITSGKKHKQTKGGTRICYK